MGIGGQPDAVGFIGVREGAAGGPRPAREAAVMSSRPATVLDSTRDAVCRGLAFVNARLRAEGMPTIDVSGRLIRPMLSVAGAVRDGLSLTPPADELADRREIELGGPDDSFWLAVAAVQMAHEASLIHDDILDDAPERRGTPTLAREEGVKRALVRGDHLLTSAYRLAAATGSLEFAALFARSVERTVAGEVAQARAAGRVLSVDEHEAIVGDKSGELLGCALAATAALRGDPAAVRRHSLGRRIGVAYQMLDDLLDYVPHARSGKPAWQDYTHRHWTWPLGELGVTGFDAPVAEIAEAMVERRSGPSALDRCMTVLEERLTYLIDEADREIGGRIVPALLGRWKERTRTIVAGAHDSPHRVAVRAGGTDHRVWTGVAGVPATAAARAAGSMPANGASDIGDSLRRRLSSERWSGAMNRYARSFSFAARLFPAADRRRVADVYAVCRLTDEIADDARDVASAEAELDDWLGLCRAAYDGQTTGIAFVDRAMHDASRSGVPFTWLEELVEGMRMDLRNERYETLSDLEHYCYRVASVVGLWLTRMFGVREPAVLERAEALGRAMQLTNILRDVGEDVSRGRVYLPRELLRSHGVTVDDVHAMANGAPLHPAWPALMEELIAAAERDYALAFDAMPDLPGFFARPVAVAAEVYRGIHDSLRSNGFDNFRFRAHTSRTRKIRLALAGLLRLRDARIRRRSGDRPASIRQANDPGLESNRSQRKPITSGRVVRAGLMIALLGVYGGASGQETTMSGHEQEQPHTGSLSGRLADVEARLAEAPDDTGLFFERLGTLWLIGVEDEEAVKTALATIDTAAAEGIGSTADARWSSRIHAYRGAFRALEGKHAFWPHQKLDRVLDGLAMMDRAVEDDPTDPHPRYLRLMTGFHLPGLFGRGDEVEADFEALTRMLPDVRGEFPIELYVEIVRFVLENGGPTPEQRTSLETALAGT
jgi:phytoene synthase